MENLKLTSIRLSKIALDKASDVASSVGRIRASEVLRIAIWIGLKCLSTRSISKLMHLMWQEEHLGVYHTLEDVLRAAGGLKDDEHAAKL